MRTYETAAGLKAETGSEEHYEDLRAWATAARRQGDRTFREEQAKMRILEAIGETIVEGALIELDIKADDKEMPSYDDILEAVRLATATALGDDEAAR